jgi:poly-beta-hydroxybutyrate-responsive repressor
MDAKDNKGHRQIEDLTLLQAHTEKLTWPCLLFLLYRKPAHGYELIQRLHDMGLQGGDADPATIYRNLRRLEEEQLVASHWETGHSGPARRLYHLTPAGEQALHVFARLPSCPNQRHPQPGTGASPPGSVNQSRWPADPRAIRIDPNTSLLRKGWRNLSKPYCSIAGFMESSLQDALRFC